MPKSFAVKTIEISVTLSQGSFGEGGNTKIIEGLACEVSVDKPGLPEKNSANIKIWGMKYDDMAQLTMLSFRPLESQNNLIQVKAGDLDGALALVFQGEITRASADFNAAPDVAMEFEADSGSYPNQIASPVMTVNGEAQAVNLFSQFAAEAGYEFKDEGVTASVQNAWFPGSPIEKCQKLARDIGCELVIDDGVIIVMPAGQAREGNAVLLNKDNGLIGYPTFNQDGIVCRCIFNPDLQYGGLMKMESIVPRATGVWKITKLSHSLSAYVPGGGNWETNIEAAYNE
ncbi:MAG: hypothetical protein LBV79_10340 [Candidatus Adiutrix sp.]|jgi:hypothetical protein|nr:hypothetical protein [Candidatus Adiutrix sp.]